MIKRQQLCIALMALALSAAPEVICQDVFNGSGHEIGIKRQPKVDPQPFRAPFLDVPIFRGTGKEIGIPEEEMSPSITDLKSTENSQEKSPLTPQAPIYLKARIEHREKLDAVPDAFRAGNPMSVEKLQSLSPDNSWRKVPKELSGTWVSEDNTIFWTRELKNVTEGGKLVQVAGRENSTVSKGRAYKRVIVGYQADRNGNQWTYDGGDLTEVIESDGYSTVDANFKRDVLAYTPEKMVIRNTSTRSTVKGSTISKTVQVEQIDTNYLVSPGVRRVEASMKIFDENGEALIENRGIRTWHRVAPFSVVNEYQGHDMHALFVEYLNTHDMAALVP